MIIRKRFPGASKAVQDEDIGPVTVLTSSLAAGNSRHLNEAIPPKRENLHFLNKDSASKRAPGESPDFNGPIIKGRGMDYDAR